MAVERAFTSWPSSFNAKNLMVCSARVRNCLVAAGFTCHR